MDLSELQQKIQKRKTKLETDDVQSDAPLPHPFPEDGGPASDEQAVNSLITKTKFSRDGSGSLRYHNTAWQSNDSRQHAARNNPISPKQPKPSVPKRADDSKGSANKPPQPTPTSVCDPFKELRRQLEQRTNKITIPEPPPEEICNQGSRSVPNLRDQHHHHNDQQGQRPAMLQRQLSEQSHVRGVSKYNTLHIYLHGGPVGSTRNLSERDRMFFVEEKFAEMKEILQAVGIVAAW